MTNTVVSYPSQMRHLARCVGLLCLVTGVMEVKVRVRVQELARDPVSTSRRGRQLSFDLELDGGVVPAVFAASLGTAMLQNVISGISTSGRYIL